MRRPWRLVPLLLLAGCLGVPGDLGNGYFGTDKLCYECDWLTSFALGGRYSIQVSLRPEVCSGLSSWDATVTGAATLASFSPPAPGDCSTSVAFDATSTGFFTIELRDLAGALLETIRMSVVAPTALTITHDTAYAFDNAWVPIDPDRLVVPVGAIVRPMAIAWGADGRPIILDPSLLEWSVEETDAVAQVPRFEPTTPLPVPGERTIGALAVGTATVRVSMGAVSGTVTIEAVPREAIPTPGYCDVFGEVCDGVDNDCDGAVDEELSLGCDLGGSVTVCDRGVCRFVECHAGFGDCDGDTWCETRLRSDPASCGACGARCDTAQRCLDGVCVD